MATFTKSDDLRGSEFVDTDLRDARFVGADLSGVVVRGVQVLRADIDAPSYAEVLDVCSGRVAMVRDFLATSTRSRGSQATIWMATFPRTCPATRCRMASGALSSG
jgi:uncharacterized protein YjbI with pentapeptide repeats